MHRLALALIASALAGCATQWTNPHLAGYEALSERQLAIDDGYCTRVASGAVPMPEIRTYESQQPQVYQIQANVSSYDYASASFTNHAISGTAAPIGTGGGFAGGMASGLAQGAALGAAMRAKRDHERVHRGCMVALGWTPK